MLTGMVTEGQTKETEETGAVESAEAVCVVNAECILDFVFLKHIPRHISVFFFFFSSNT